MNELAQVLLLTTMAGSAIPIGGLLAKVEKISPEWLETEFRHSVIAFGGGVLVSAVALVLVPEGIKELALPWIISAFVLGGLAFWGLETLLDRSKSSMAQLVAMLSDFVPEAVALGAAFATGEGAGMLLAVLIGLQNLPEGFNAYRELDSSSKLKGWKLIACLAACVPLGPLAGWLSTPRQFPSCGRLHHVVCGQRHLVSDVSRSRAASKNRKSASTSDRSRFRFPARAHRARVVGGMTCGCFAGIRKVARARVAARP